MPSTIHPAIRKSAAIVAVLTATTLVGCTGGQSDSSTGGPVTLSLTLLATSVGSPYGEMAKKYSEQHPDVSFNIEEIPNEQYGEVLRTRFQAGNAPDMFFTDAGSGSRQGILPFAKAGYVLPLNDSAAEKLIDEDDKELVGFDGSIYGQPLDYVPMTTNFNQTVAESIGIQLPLTSVDNVLDSCKKAADAGKSLFVLAGASVPNTANTAIEIAASRVYAKDPDWDTLRNNGEVTFANSTEWRESLELIVKLNEAGCFQPGATAGSIADNTPAVAAGKSLASFSPGGATGDMKRSNPDNTYIATAFPGDDKDSTRVFSSPLNLLGVSASVDDQKKKAALDFLAWLAEPETAAATADLSGNMPIQVEGTQTQPAQYALIKDILAPEKTQTLPNVTWSPEVVTALGQGVQGLLTGQTTVTATLEAMDAAWDQAADQ
ncbi:ABC transporter substrate-binding protein [Arthrobacter sp. SD76]|uniref:ABC transporter substrate-binding protein n=1 Tax=Arthrobacter sp. SD76 TaxID=3415007 RepID=UPI003C750B2D